MSQSVTKGSVGVSVSQAACNVSVVGSNRAAMVTVNNGAPVCYQPPSSTAAVVPRRVLITPLSSGGILPPGVAVNQKPPTVIEKVLLKAISKDKGVGGPKVFTLRNVDSGKIVSRDDLKGEIRTQLHGDIVLGNFDVGFVSGTSMISIRNPADLADVWAEIRKGKKVLLWCDGLKKRPSVTSNQRKRVREPDGDETDEEVDELCTPSRKKKSKSAQEEREEKVQSLIEKLKERHGALFTPMQMRIWSEMVVGGIHSSLDDAPTSSMFTRAGRSGSGKKKDERNTSMAEALTQAAVAISSAMSPRSSLPSNQPMGTSPAKLIESRSKCYKQLSDLNNLKVTGVLTEEEYADEKKTIMSILNKLKGN